MEMMRVTYILLSCLLLSGCSQQSQARPIRVSFLNDEASLDNSLRMLKTNGCTQTACDAFAKSVRHYYNSPFRLQLSAFPQPTNGFYSFDSAVAFTRALPHRLNDTQHPFDVNCFFVVLALSKLNTSVRLDDSGHPLLAFVNVDGFNWRACPVATPRDAFSASYGPAYPGHVEKISGLRMTEAQMCLDACLHTVNVLPHGTKEDDLPKTILTLFKSRWAQQQIQFPQDTSVTMFHSVDLSKSFHVVTDHAGLLIPTPGGYTYFEKAGGAGPFLRLDISEISDLITYNKSFITDQSRGDMTHYLMTVNDQEVYWVEPQQSSAPYRLQPRDARLQTSGER
jgi:hypothetical protein